MPKALHDWNEIKRLYATRNEGGSALTCIKHRVDTSIQQLEDNIKKSKGRLLTANKKKRK